MVDSPELKVTFPFEAQDEGGVPVIHPTWEQFKDFRAFIDMIEPYGRHAGLVKVVPPAEWKQNVIGNDYLTEKLSNVRIKAPIIQNITSNGLTSTGTFRQFNTLVRRSYSVQGWHDLCEEHNHRPPLLLDGSERPRTHSVVPASNLQRKRKRSEKCNVDSDRTIAKHADHHPKLQHITSPPNGCSLLSPSAEVVSTNEASHSMEPESPPTDALVPSNAAVSPITTTKNTDGRVTTMDLDAPTAIPRRSCQHISADDNQVISDGVNNDETTPPTGSLCLPKEEPSTTAKPRQRKFYDPEPISFDIAKVSQGYSDQYCVEMERLYWKSVTSPASSPMYGADMLGSLFDGTEANTWNPASLDNILNNISAKLPGVNQPYLYFGMWKATFAWHVEDVDLYSINYIHFGAPKHWYVIQPSQREKFERYARGVYFEEARSCPEFLRHKTCLMSPANLASHGIKVNKMHHFAGEFMITYPHGYHAGFNLGFNCAESVNFATESWIDIGLNAHYCQCVKDSVKLDIRTLFGLKEPTPPPPVIAPIKEPESPKQCCLCPMTAEIDMLETDSPGLYAHRRCALFIPETCVIAHPDIPDKDVVIGIGNIPKDRWVLKCQFCKKLFGKSKKVPGACIQCYKGRCVRTYHVSCADMNDILMTDDFMCFCPQHDGRKKFKAEEVLTYSNNEEVVEEVLEEGWSLPQTPIIV